MENSEIADRACTAKRRSAAGSRKRRIRTVPAARGTDKNNTYRSNGSAIFAIPTTRRTYNRLERSAETRAASSSTAFSIISPIVRKNYKDTCERNSRTDVHFESSVSLAAETFAFGV